MKILVIENEPRARADLRHLLERHGHAVIEADSGEDGLRRAREQPDCVLCDVGLPGMNGFEVVTAIQREPRSCATPVILLSGSDSHGDDFGGGAEHRSDCLTAPFTEHQIIEAIATRTSRPKPLRDRVRQLLAAGQDTADSRWSHELTAPLDGMLGSLALLEAEGETLERGELRHLLGLLREAATRHQQSARRLIVYHDLTREEIGSRSHPVASDARTALQAAVCAARASRPSRSADLVVRSVPGLVLVSGQGLVHAIGELLDNAMRYSRTGQPVGVSGFIEDGHYCIAVADEGPGLTRDERARLRPFVCFKRDSADRPGLGLGLAIAGSVARLAGGRLSLQPRPCGVGLVATLTLPLTDTRN